jgi:hypothetical protein
MNDEATNQKQPMTMVCAHCGSDEILADAYGEWSVPEQRWVLASVMDKGHYCNACDSECAITERPVGEVA